jgi:hypothetical protein
MDRSRRAVLSHFARDVDVIRSLVGDVLRVGALGSSSADAAYANLTVQMSGEGPEVIRWSIGPITSGGNPGGWLKLIGTKTSLELPQPGDETACLQHVAESVEGADDNAPWDARIAALDQLAHAIELRDAGPNWPEAIRDIELAEAIPRSLVRGRTIEVQHEQPTEAGTFKGLMTSLGCGLLLTGLGVILVLAMLDAVARANNWRAFAAFLRPWPWVMSAVFGVFLVFQLLLRLTKRDDGRDGEE